MFKRVIWEGDLITVVGIQEARRENGEKSSNWREKVLKFPKLLKGIKQGKYSENHT